MKKNNQYWLLAALMLFFAAPSFGQEDTTKGNPEDTQILEIKSRGLQRVGNAFESIYLIDNQTVLVPLKNTFEFDIHHRFGVVKNGYEDLFGIYAPTNTRIGFGYTPLNKVMVNIGVTRERMVWDAGIKYAIFSERGPKAKPLSMTYYGSIGVDSRSNQTFRNGTDRISYFHQLMVAKKVNRDFSVQASLNVSHFNNVEAYIAPDGMLKSKMKNDHLSASLIGRYKFSDAMAFIWDIDQPITKHTTNNPYPNVSAGLEIATPLHAFQVFLGNYRWIVPQYNNMFNMNNYKNGQWSFGFNITRLLDMEEESLKGMLFKRKHKK